MTMVNWSTHMVFAETVKKESRVAAVAPVINKMIETYELGEIDDGVEVFQEMLVQKIRAAGLLDDDVWLQFEVVGVHPDNRETGLLVPIDAHTLLALMFKHGFVMKKVDNLGCRVPPNSTGAKWKAVNEALQKGSRGLLPDLSTEKIEAVTVRGSHTTAGIKALKFGAKCAQGCKMMAVSDEKLSATLVVEQRPSFKLPLEKGMPYTLVDHELVAACPKLMHFLSRTGNQSHGVHRIATALQNCLCVHNAWIGSHGDADAAKRIACQGQPEVFEQHYDSHKAFVKEHSGGEGGKYLKALESYERSLAVKRFLRPSDLAKLGSVKMPEAPRYVPALVKAMLNSPAGKVAKDGFSDLFSMTDFSSLADTGKNRKHAIHASELMIDATSFLNAYSKLDEELQANEISKKNFPG